MPVSKPTMAKRRWPSASMSATMSLDWAPRSSPLWGLSASPIPALIGRDDFEVMRQCGHHQPPLVPGLRPAMDQQEWTTLAANDGVKAHAIGVDVSARERVREPRRQIRCSEDGAWAGRDAS